MRDKDNCPHFFIDDQDQVVDNCVYCGTSRQEEFNHWCDYMHQISNELHLLALPVNSYVH